MSDSEHRDPQGQLRRRAAGQAAGRRRAAFAVFINGVEQSEGADYDVRAGEIVFTRPIVKEKVGTGRWLAMYLGLFGTYRKNETIDLQFTRDGKTELVSDLAGRSRTDVRYLKT